MSRCAGVGFSSERPQRLEDVVVGAIRSVEPEAGEPGGRQQQTQ
jgi:hypothetical protein